MTKILIIYKDDYADEFDVSGFTIIEPEQLSTLEEDAKALFAEIEAENKEMQAECDEVAKTGGYKFFSAKAKDFSFGSNESMFYSSYAEFKGAHTIKEITDEEAEIIIRLFDTDSFGTEFFTYSSEKLRDELEFGDEEEEDDQTGW